MRVFHVMASGDRGGGADHLAALAPSLVRLGIECSAVVSSDGPLAGRLAGLGIPVVGLEMMRSRVDPAAVLGLKRLVRQQHPDLIHCHGTRAGFFAALSRPDPPLVYTVHGLAYRQGCGVVRRGMLLAAEALACHAAAEVLSVSAADLEDLRRRHALSRDRGLHISNAVDTERFSPGDRSAIRARLGLSSESIVVGTVSRLVPQKSVGDLIDAVLACAGLNLVVVGDGPERCALEARAAHGSDRIQFLGSRDDVPDILKALDIFALSSRWEGEPIALLEAMATGLACVATATSGAAEVLADVRTGLLVEIGRPQAMAAALMRLAGDAPARRAMGEAARATVRGRSWGAVAAQIAAVYQRIDRRRF